MTDKERELLGKGLLEDSTIKDVIDYFGADMILDKIDDSDIAERVDVCVLNLIDDDALIDAINDTDKMLDSLSMEHIESYLNDGGYSVIDTLKLEEGNILKKIKGICHELQPNGYIGKEDAKKLLCDYLDFWMDRSF